VKKGQKKTGIGSVINNQLIPYEDEEQMVVAQWLVWNEVRFNHSPAEGDHTIQYRRKQHAMGLFPGFPDLHLPASPPAKPEYKGTYIELKRQKGGSVSPEQRDWITYLRANGYYCEICKGAREAIPLLRELGYTLKNRLARECIFLSSTASHLIRGSQNSYEADRNGNELCQ